jgi:hypothetical protein
MVARKLNFPDCNSYLNFPLFSQPFFLCRFNYRPLFSLIECVNLRENGSQSPCCSAATTLSGNLANSTWKELYSRCKVSAASYSSIHRHRDNGNRALTSFAFEVSGET